MDFNVGDIIKKTKIYMKNVKEYWDSMSPSERIPLLQKIFISTRVVAYEFDNLPPHIRMFFSKFD